MESGGFFTLLGAEDPVAGIAQAGNDVGMVIELFVAGSQVHLHVGMGSLDSPDALGAADDVHHDDVLAAVLLQEVDGSHSGAAGSQHGVNHEGDAVLDILRKLAVVFHRLVGLGVTVQADVADLGGGDQCKLPEDIENRVTFVVDPMLATGGSAVAAIDFLKKHGCKNIIMMNIIGCPEGIATVQAAHPDVDIYMAACDERLNEHKYIIPGLGDAGDRIFGTK